MSIPEDVLCRDLDGESVLLHLGSGQYFGLDEVGTFVWHLLAEGCGVAEVKERILTEYEATPERVDADVERIVKELGDNNLVEFARGQPGRGGQVRL